MEFLIRPKPVGGNGLMLRVERRLRRKGGLREGLVERSRDRGTSGRNVKQSGS